MSKLSENDREALELAEAHRYGHTARVSEIMANRVERLKARAEKAEAERDALRARFDRAEADYEEDVANALAWARRWKRAARWYRNQHGADVAQIDDLLCDARELRARLAAAESTLARYRSAERMPALCSCCRPWVRLPEGE